MTSEKINSSPLEPGLYLVATPIGHLGDMSLRAIEVLRGVDKILCEDTRVTRHLLKHYAIDRPVGIYNEQSDGQDPSGLIGKIQAGARLALVSDAGMPLMSDPGFSLVRACRSAGVKVTVVPGASAILSALALSGLPTDRFMFFGFLSTKQSERQGQLQSVAAVPATLIFFERAERVSDVLSDITAVLGVRSVAVVREITKMFEETLVGNSHDLEKSIRNNPIKGEVVIVVDRGAGAATMNEAQITQALQDRLAAGVRLRQAVDDVTALAQVPRKRVYDLALAIRDE
jgi:16S rRNA (cytidine1402-2'-O)-methyltransferase